jgi:hypothetical protein
MKYWLSGNPATVNFVVMCVIQFLVDRVYSIAVLTSLRMRTEMF